MSKKKYYFNAAAHVAPSAQTLKSYCQFSTGLGGHGHPSGLNASDREAARELENARQTIASLLGAQDSSQIIFTSSCTQACAWGLQILRFLTPEGSRAVSPIEHSAVRSVTSDFQLLLCNSDGEVQRPYNSDIQAAAIVGTQNEFGTQQNLLEVKYSWKIPYIFSDLSQTAGKEKISLDAVDLAAFGAHKWGGLPGLGVLYMQNIDYWQSFSGQPGFFLDQPGTPHVGAAVAAATALQEANNSWLERQQKMLDFQSTLEFGLKNRGYSIVAEDSPRSLGITLVAGWEDSLSLLLDLEKENIFVGVGSACSSLESEVSPALQALGRTETKENLLRISTFGEYDGKDAQHFLQILDNKVKK